MNVETEMEAEMRKGLQSLNHDFEIEEVYIGREYVSRIDISINSAVCFTSAGLISINSDILCLLI